MLRRYSLSITRNPIFIASAVLALLAGCGGTWVDDARTFERVFGFAKPEDVRVLHGVYWKSSHFTVEYGYFIAITASKRFADGLTSGELMSPVASNESVITSCGQRPHPLWFLPKSITNYGAWVPKASLGYRVFRDKMDGTIFVCDERL